MKNGFLRKYWLCIMLSVIMAFSMFLSTVFADLYVSGKGYIRFDLGELFLIFGLPLYSLIYGCLSYIKVQKIWLPQLILFLVAFLYWFRFDMNALAWAGTFIWSAYPVIFSLIGTVITAFICYIIKSSKENQN